MLAVLLDWLRQRDDLQMIGTDDPELRVPTVSLVPRNKTIDEIFTVLTAHKLMVGQGHFYGVRPLMGMNIPLDTGVLRLSFLHYTTEEEIYQLIEGLSLALE